MEHVPNNEEITISEETMITEPVEGCEGDVVVEKARIKIRLSQKNKKEEDKQKERWLLLWVIKDEDVREMDKLIKSLCLDHKVRVIVDTTDLCEEARKRHDLWPTAAAALGRVMSMGAIMGSLQKNAQEKVTLQIRPAVR